MLKAIEVGMYAVAPGVLAEPLPIVDIDTEAKLVYVGAVRERDEQTIGLALDELEDVLVWRWTSWKTCSRQTSTRC